MPEAWEITPLNSGEKTVAAALIAQLRHGGYLLAAGSYDSNALFDQAWKRGYQLMTPMPTKGTPGAGPHYQSPQRPRSIPRMSRAFRERLEEQRTANRPGLRTSD